MLQRDGEFSIKTSWLGPRHLSVEYEGMPLNAQNGPDLRKPPEEQEDHWKDVTVTLKCPR